MTFAAKANRTVQDLWKELDDAGSRVLLTIPFGVSIDEAKGFISVTGDVDSELPILTFCVENVLAERCTISTLVFPSKEEYLSFINKIWADHAAYFEEFDLN